MLPQSAHTKTNIEDCLKVSTGIERKTATPMIVVIHFEGYAGEVDAGKSP